VAYYFGIHIYKYKRSLIILSVLTVITEWLAVLWLHVPKCQNSVCIPEADYYVRDFLWVSSVPIGKCWNYTFVTLSIYLPHPLCSLSFFAYSILHPFIYVALHGCHLGGGHSYPDSVKIYSIFGFQI
jgi:hypothetical protein